ncbi:unnamed protein product [Arctogadus glacialis]
MLSSAGSPQKALEGEAERGAEEGDGERAEGHGGSHQGVEKVVSLRWRAPQFPRRPDESFRYKGVMVVAFNANQGCLAAVAAGKQSGGDRPRTAPSLRCHPSGEHRAPCRRLPDSPTTQE